MLAVQGKERAINTISVRRPKPHNTVEMKKDKVEIQGD